MQGDAAALVVGRDQRARRFRSGEMADERLDRDGHLRRGGVRGEQADPALRRRTDRHQVPALVEDHLARGRPVRGNGPAGASRAASARASVVRHGRGCRVRRSGSHGRVEPGELQRRDPAVPVGEPVAQGPAGRRLPEPPGLRQRPRRNRAAATPAASGRHPRGTWPLRRRSAAASGSAVPGFDGRPGRCRASRPAVLRRLAPVCQQPGEEQRGLVDGEQRAVVEGNGGLEDGQRALGQQSALDASSATASAAPAPVVRRRQAGHAALHPHENPLSSGCPVPAHRRRSPRRPNRCP